MSFWSLWLLFIGGCLGYFMGARAEAKHRRPMEQQLQDQLWKVQVELQEAQEELEGFRDQLGQGAHAETWEEDEVF